MSKYILVSGVVGLVFLVGAYSIIQTTNAPADTAIEASVGFKGQLTASEVQQKIEEGYVVLDVRTLAEFNEVRISDDVVLIDFYAADFRQKLASLDTSESYILHCRSGARSGKTVEIMKNLGFSNFYELQGGINSWQQAGLPTISQ